MILFVVQASALRPLGLTIDVGGEARAERRAIYDLIGSPCGVRASGSIGASSAVAFVSAVCASATAIGALVRTVAALDPTEREAAPGSITITITMGATATAPLAAIGAPRATLIAAVALVTSPPPGRGVRRW